MEAAAKTLFMGSNPELLSQRQRESFQMRITCFLKTRVYDNISGQRTCSRKFSVACAASPALGLEVRQASKSNFKDFSVSTRAHKDNNIQVRVDASGAKTQDIFDDVFAKLVEAAQPIPGFRRVKGGKTPDIPRDVLLQILGPSKVNKYSIKKIINSTMAEYVEKEGLKVTKDLRVHQSYEELEETFAPGKEFSFDATIQLQETK